jgi:hypothetical protein
LSQTCFVKVTLHWTIQVAIYKKRVLVKRRKIFLHKEVCSLFRDCICDDTTYIKALNTWARSWSFLGCNKPNALYFYTTPKNTYFAVIRETIWALFTIEKGWENILSNFRYSMCDNYVPQWVEFDDALSWLFTKRFRGFYLICRNSQILLKISFIPIPLTFIYLVALNLLVNNQLKSLSNSTHHFGA